MTCTHFVAMFGGAPAVSNSSQSICDPSIRPSLRFANMAAVRRATVRTTSARELGATLAPSRVERHVFSLHIFETLGRTLGILSSPAFFFSSIGKTTADHPRAIVQFVPVRECGRRITQRI